MTAGTSTVKAALSRQSKADLEEVDKLFEALSSPQSRADQARVADGLRELLESVSRQRA